jgi:gluconokinase
MASWQLQGHVYSRLLRLDAPPMLPMCWAQMLPDNLSLRIYSYADTRSAAAARMLRERLDEIEIWQRTGCPLRTSYLPVLFTWLAQTQPQVLRAVQRWMSAGEWLFDVFFGRSPISSSAASWTGLLNRTSLRNCLRII